MTPKVNGPAMAATMNRPDSQIDRQQSSTSNAPAWQVPSLADFEQRVHDLEVIADWRDELTARIARERLIYEFADCTKREAFDALEAEVALFNRVCLAIAKAGLEGESS